MSLAIASTTPTIIGAGASGDEYTPMGLGVVFPNTLGVPTYDGDWWQAAFGWTWNVPGWKWKSGLSGTTACLGPVLWFE